jgi:uncharacterized protein YoxC
MMIIIDVHFHVYACFCFCLISTIDTQLESQRLAKLDLELSQLTQESTQLPKAIQQLQDEIQSKQQQIQELQSDINSLSQHNAIDMSTLRAASELVHSSLGVTFHVSLETGLRISYMYIDVQRPQRQFHVSIAVDQETNSYVTRECSPLLPQIASYLAELNQKGAPFSFFVQRCRQGFKQIAQEEAQQQQ